MNPRTTGILLGVALALGAFVHFYVIGGEEGRQEAEEHSKRLFGEVEQADVTWLAFTTSEGRAVRAELSDGRWEIVEPVRFPGDGVSLDAVAGAASEALSEASYEEPQPLGVYGLEPGAPEFRFGSEAGEFALRTGKKTPIGGNTYALVVGETPVHVISQFQANALTKSLNDVRSRKILDFDTDSVRRVVATWPDGRVELLREGEAWKMVAPLEVPADANAVQELLSDLAFLRATGFEDAPGSDDELGFDRPELSVELELAPAEGEAESRRLALAISAGVVESDRYVRSGWPSLYRIPAARLDDFERDVIAYRFKELARFPAGDARRVELRFRDPVGDDVVIVAERGEEGWSSTPEAIEPEKIALLVDELSRLVADDILAERVGPEERASLELDPPNAAFVVSGEGEGPEARLAEVRLGRIRSGGGVVAQAGEEPQVYELAIALGQFLPLNLEGFRNHFLAAETEPEPAAMSEGEPALEFEGEPALEFEGGLEPGAIEP